MAHPKTAVLVLNYNGLELTKKFFTHLYRGTENFSVIMVDNGSTDGSVEYLSKLAIEKSNFFFSASDKNLGVINGRNYAYELFQLQSEPIPYLIHLDNDQFVQPGWLDQHFEVMQQSNAQMVGVEAWLMNSGFSPIRQCKKLSDPWTYIGCGGTLMSVEVPDKIGMFDTRFNPCYFEDPDFCFRAIEAGFKMAWNSKAKITHLAHQTLGKRTDRMIHFKNSHKKLREKWQGKTFRPQRQPFVSALE
jgi:O-antigen biosynthesis protein